MTKRWLAGGAAVAILFGSGGGAAAQQVELQPASPYVATLPTPLTGTNITRPGDDGRNPALTIYGPPEPYPADRPPPNYPERRIAAGPTDLCRALAQTSPQVSCR